MTPISGPLLAEYADRLDWSRLPKLLDEAILGQQGHVRTGLLGSLRPEHLSAEPFDPDGYLTVYALDTPLLRFHWSRLMPGAPMGVGDAVWLPPIPDDISGL